MELLALARQTGRILFLAAALSAQDSPPGDKAQTALTNTGKPLLVPFRCTPEDIQWAGMSCTEDEPCPVYLELTSVEAVGSRLFVAGNIHSQTVTLYSLLLGSPDTGGTWHEVHARIRGAGLDRIQFTDFENGWASGEALSPLPQDPFLLITSDGGTTWRQHAIFSETRVGSIQQFFFKSKNDGSLVIDRGPGTDSERYELYESANAGETWTIKEANRRPIPLQGPPPAVPLWRVQADGSTQAYRIEHQQGGRWNAAASFAVSLGSCMPSQDSPPPAAPGETPIR